MRWWIWSCELSYSACDDGGGHRPTQDCVRKSWTKFTSGTNRAATHRTPALAQRLGAPEFGEAGEEVWPSHVDTPGISAMRHRFFSRNGYGVSQETGHQLVRLTAHPRGFSHVLRSRLLTYATYSRSLLQVLRG
jgi:hypothetical protein